MCIGEVLRVVAGEGSFAWCEGDGTRERIDMILVGAQPAGTWLLVFHGAARQVLDESEAAGMRAARRALAALLSGDASGIDACFADLVDRRPSLPAHLQGGRT
jgi:hydrogenase expression/formation protein HypC